MTDGSQSIDRQESSVVEPGFSCYHERQSENLIKQGSIEMHSVEDRNAFSRQVQDMFSNIAPRYDLLNKVLSLGLDKYWRRKAVDRLNPQREKKYLDLATGTADVALEIARRTPNAQIVGADFNQAMLELATRKVKRHKQTAFIELKSASAESLPFDNASFNGIITAFGVRNFSDIEQSLREMWRVLEPAGKTVILEFSLPNNALLEFGYRIDFDHVLPFIGRLVSGHPNAYQYLPDSVGRFPGRDKFSRLLQQAGFQNVTYSDLTCGVVTIYSGVKPPSV